MIAMDSEETKTSNRHDESSASQGETEDGDQQMQIKIHFHGKQFSLRIDDTMTIAGLSTSLTEKTSIAPEKQKIMITPRPGLLKPPFPDTLLSTVYNPSTSKLTLLGNTDIEISEFNTTITKSQTQRQNRLEAGRAAPKAAKYRDRKKAQDETTYTFHSIRPLSHLPDSHRSQRFLQKLAADPGVKATMLAHKFSVGLLTEMDPAEHTTFESRTLGLNRNGGEVIELRLRTDRYDGYRDYNTIRKTLCHELAHNVFSEHDRDFWDLTAQIEEEVQKGDWKHGGHRLSGDEFYNPNQNDEGVLDEKYIDTGGWRGGESVLGSDSNLPSSPNQRLSRRDLLAQAAMARMQRERKAPRDPSQKSDDSNNRESSTR
jgi:hypothetical protein